MSAGPDLTAVVDVTLSAPVRDGRASLALVDRVTGGGLVLDLVVA